MEDLAKIVEGCPDKPQRAKGILNQVLPLLEDILQCPEEEKHRCVALEELPAVGAKLLTRCGFVKATSGDDLYLPRDAPLIPLQEACTELRRLMAKVDLAVQCQKAKLRPAPTANSLAGTQASTAAAALRIAAMKMSPLKISLNVDADSWSGDTDKLSACRPTPSRRLAGEEKPKEIKHQVPPTVLATAAALTQTLAQQHPIRFRATRSGDGGQQYGGRGVPREREMQNAGASIWCAAPPGITAESRLVVELPESDFTYIERPWSHFVTRWAAIDVELEAAFGGDAQFSLLDLGSCMGFFSIQVAVAYRQSIVLGVEGSVGVGNGTTGVQGTTEEIIATKAVQTHIRWIEKLGLGNCFVAPDVWDYRRVCGLAALGRPIVDVMLSLSVIHHIDNVSKDQYTSSGLSEVAGTVKLMAKVLLLARRHFVELPDQPWMEHIHRHFQSPRKFLEAAAQASQKQWNFVGPLCICTWYGTRELWLIEESPAPVLGAPSSAASAMAPEGLHALFPRMLGYTPQQRVAAVGGGAIVPQKQASQMGYSSSAVRQSVGAGTQPPTNLPGMSPPQQDLGSALLAAPTTLIAAHVQLREGIDAAVALLTTAETPPRSVAEERGN